MPDRHCRADTGQVHRESLGVRPGSLDAQSFAVLSFTREGSGETAALSSRTPGCTTSERSNVFFVQTFY